MEIFVFVTDENPNNERQNDIEFIAKIQHHFSFHLFGFCLSVPKFVINIISLKLNIPRFND